MIDTQARSAANQRYLHATIQISTNALIHKANEYLNALQRKMVPIVSPVLLFSAKCLAFTGTIPLCQPNGKCVLLVHVDSHQLFTFLLTTPLVVKVI